jgi:hypothetical protein
MNRINPKGLENQVIDLGELDKKEILSLLTQQATYRDKYYIGLSEENDIYVEPQAKDLITLSEYLESQGLELTKADKHRLAGKITLLYKRDNQGRKPRVITRPDKRGLWQLKVNGFRFNELHILDEALEWLRDHHRSDIGPE